MVNLFPFFNRLDRGEYSYLENSIDQVPLDDSFSLILYYHYQRNEIKEMKNLLEENTTNDIWIKLWQLTIDLETGNFSDAERNLTLLNTLRTQSDPEYYRDLLYHYLMVEYLIQTNQFNSLTEYIENSINSLNLDNFRYLNAKLCRSIGNYYLIIEEFPTSIAWYERCLEAISGIDDKVQLAKVYNNLGLCYYNLNDLSNALHRFKQAQVINLEINNTASYHKSTLNLGMVLMSLGQLVEAEQTFSGISNYFIENNMPYEQASLLLKMGVIKGMKGEISESIRIFHNAKEIYEELEDKIGLANSHNNTGLAYLRLDRKQKAYEHFKKSELLTENLEDNPDQIEWIFNLYQVTRMMGLVEKEKYLDKLERYQDNDYTKLVKSIELIDTKRHRNMAKAQISLKSLVHSNQAIIDIKILSSLELTNTLIDEYRLSQDEEIISEIEDQIIELNNLSSIQNSNWLKAQVLVLQAKLSLIQSDVAQAKRLLSNGQNLAEESGFMLLAESISNEFDSLLSDISELEKGKMDEQKMKELGIKELRKHISNLKINRIESDETLGEEPISLFILTSSGLSAYKHHFIKLIKRNEQLIGGFLNAINSLLGEILSVEETVERIKLKQYTLIFRTVDSYAFLYIVKGRTYQAVHKLEQLITEITSKANIWEGFKMNMKIGRIDQQFVQRVDLLREQIFI